MHFVYEVPSVQARNCLCVPVLWLGLAASAAGQFQDAGAQVSDAGETAVDRWRIGFVLLTLHAAQLFMKVVMMKRIGAESLKSLPPMEMSNAMAKCRKI